MLLDLATLLALAPACAPAVAPTTLLAVAKVESGFDPFAIGINGPTPRRLTFPDRGAAAQAARTLIAQGRNVDLGLAQVNVRNLGWLGLSVEAAFDPCRNLAASAQVLQAGYIKASRVEALDQAAVRTALSYYNTGDAHRGYANGYVTKVTSAARHLVPEIAAPPSAEQAAPEVRHPAWDVFGGRSAERSAFVISPNPRNAP